MIRMSHSPAGTPRRAYCFHVLLQVICAAPIFVIPFVLFLAVFVALLTQYGGHRMAIITEKNQFCNVSYAHSEGNSSSSVPRLSIVIQVSDLHINDIDDGQAKLHASLFTEVISTRWSRYSDAIIATGDLVNSQLTRKYPFGVRSRQSPLEAEWLNDFARHINNSVPWLAVPGNHDSFGLHAVDEKRDTHVYRYIATRLNDFARLINGSVPLALARGNDDSFDLHTDEASDTGTYRGIAKWLNDFARKVNHSAPSTAVPGNHDSCGFRENEESYTGSSTIATRTIFKGTSVDSPVGPHMLLAGLHSTAATPIHRPFNFFGDLSRSISLLDMQLRGLERDGHKDTNVLVFGHHPSAIMKHGTKLHKLAYTGTKEILFNRPRFAAYLSGHLHTLKGLMNRGMQVVANSGALELQSPDMVQAGVFRVLAIYGDSLSFRDFSVRSVDKHPLDNAIMLHPPEAGLCAAGAGADAATLAQISVFVPGAEKGLDAEVFIDDERMGSLEKLVPNTQVKCQDNCCACPSIYFVNWDPTRYQQGSHHLAIYSNGTLRHSYFFSLDGSPDPRWRVRLKTFVSALFLLSDFPTIAWWLCNIGNLISLLFLILTSVKGKNCLELFCLLVVVHTGPILISDGLGVNPETRGILTLRGTILGSFVYEPGVDSYYLTAIHVIWRSLVPLCYLKMLSAWNIYPRVQLVFGFPFIFLYIYQCLSWCVELAGAHGIFACALSPSGMWLLSLSLMVARQYIETWTFAEKN